MFGTAVRRTLRGGDRGTEAAVLLRAVFLVHGKDVVDPHPERLTAA
ncbi:MAG: hypothetical protein M3N00_05215 [Actinomycetota bacterium]|nr:hypothetical protein [Actinomycetota bacterium]